MKKLLSMTENINIGIGYVELPLWVNIAGAVILAGLLVLFVVSTVKKYRWHRIRVEGKVEQKLVMEDSSGRMHYAVSLQLASGETQRFSVKKPIFYSMEKGDHIVATIRRDEIVKAEATGK